MIHNPEEQMITRNTIGLSNVLLHAGVATTPGSDIPMEGNTKTIIRGTYVKVLLVRDGENRGTPYQIVVRRQQVSNF